MSASEIRDLSSRFEIGSHTYDHCFLKSVSLTESHYQVTEGKARLEDILGKQVTGFCYPGGKYRAADVEIVKASGFRYARTTVNLCFDAGNKPFEMPTTVQLYPHERNIYVRNFAKSGDWSNRQKGLFLAIQKKDWIKRLYALFDHAVDRNACFHLWWHSKDIDTHSVWNDLDEFLAYVSSKVAPHNRLTNEQLAARYF